MFERVEKKIWKFISENDDNEDYRVQNLNFDIEVQ